MKPIFAWATNLWTGALLVAKLGIEEGRGFPPLVRALTRHVVAVSLGGDRA